MAIWLEPKWKSYIVASNAPLFTKEQCEHIIRVGQTLEQEDAKVGSNLTDHGTVKDAGINDAKKRITTVSWLPLNHKETDPMYTVVDRWVKNININHFGFEGIQIGERAQYTEYPTGAFYNWHTDSNVSMQTQPIVRKMSMTCLLSDPSEFEGGELELIGEEDTPKQQMKQGHAVFFASFISHRVKPVTKGNRKSLVMWFSGPPFK